jgi:hypothetical protein
MLRMTGRFLAHVLQPVDAARELFRHFFDAIRRRASLPPDDLAPWDWLAAQPRLDPPTLAHLHALHSRAVAGQRVDLVALRNLIHDITGRLA